MPKQKTLKVNYGAAKKLPLKSANPLTGQQRAGKVKSPYKSLFDRLQKQNRFVSGTNLGNKISDIFGNLSNAAGNIQTPPFNDSSLPQTGPGRMQEMENVTIYQANKKRDNTLLYIAAAVGIFLIIKSK